MLDRQAKSDLTAPFLLPLLEHLRAAREEGIDLAASESSRAKASSDMAIVKAAISEVNEQDSQAGILKVLVTGRVVCPRVAFSCDQRRTEYWLAGARFQGTVGDNAVHQMSFQVSADTSVGHAARSRDSWSGSSSSHSENHLILNRLGDEPPSRIVAVPLVVRNRSVAVLYADSADLDSDAINLEAIETLVSVSGMAVELLVARAAPAAQPAAPAEEAPVAEEAAHAEQPSYTPAVEYDEITPVVEESAPAAEVTEFEATPEPHYAAPEVEYQPEPQPYVAEIELPRLSGSAG